MKLYPGFQEARLPVVAAAILMLAAGCSSNEPTPAPTSESAASSTVEPSPTVDVQMAKIQNASGSILFAASTADNDNHDIYMGDLATGTVVNITNTPDLDELNPQVSPDSTKAVFDGQDSAGNYQIFGLDIAHKNISKITNHNANSFDPTFTRDGQHILYKSNADDGYGDIWTMNSDGTNQKNVTAGMSQTEEWKPTAISNDEILFTSRQADDGSKSREALSKTDELYSLKLSNGDNQPVRLTFNNRSDWYSEATKKPGQFTYVTKLIEGDSDTIFVSSVKGGKMTKPEQLNPSNQAGDSSDGSMMADNKTLLYVNNGSNNYRAYATNGTQNFEVAASTGDVLSPVAIGDARIG